MSSKAFTADVQRFVRVSKERADVAVRRIALGLLANVVVASPVDTGRFRGNWQVGVDARPEGETAPDKDAGAVVTRGQAKLEGVHAGGRIFIANNLPYALRLEYGWSRQAPAGMVRMTMRNIGEIVGDVGKED